MKRIPVKKEKAAATGQSSGKVKGVFLSEHSLRFVRFGAALLFFGIFFIFLMRFIDPAVIYSSNGMNIHHYVAAMHAQDASMDDSSVSYSDPWFRNLFILELTPEYVRDVATTPGGLARLTVTLCIYACRFPLAGALVLTGLALFFCWVFTWYLQGIGTRLPLVLRFVPAFFVLTACVWYELRYCAFLLLIVGALIVAVFYRRLQPAADVTRVVWLTALFWIAWYVMTWGSLLALLFIGIYELFRKERRVAIVAVAAAVNGAALCLVDAGFVPLDKAIRWNDFLEPSGLPLVVIGFFPLATIILAVLGRFGRLSEGRGVAIGSIVHGCLFVCGVSAAGVWLCRDPVNRDTRTVARTVFHVMNGKWDAVLKEKTDAMFADFPRKAGALQVFMVHAVNRALCSTGSIGDRMFSFPQAVFSYDPLLMLQSTFMSGFVNWVIVLDLAMDLGMVNTAEKIAGELMETMGPYPDILHRRALVQIAKANDEAAAVYLGKLAGMPFYRAEARRLLGMLGTAGGVASEPRIAAMRANMDTVDYFMFNNISHDVLLRRLLQSNPGSKIAYDYLMSYCLLVGQLEDAAAIAPAASSFGYITLPRYWEEALCLYQSVSSLQASSEVSFSGLRQETIDRFYRFFRAWATLENDPEAAAKLAPAFGDSYFYFSIFRHSRGVYHE